MSKPKLKWKDISSFSRSDTARVPYAFEATVCNFRLTVSRHIHAPPTAWIVRFLEREVVLDGGTAEAAQAYAELQTLRLASAIAEVLK